MPYTKEQRKLFGVAFRSPGKLHKRNRSLAKMPKEKLREMIHSGLKTKRG